MKQGKSVITLVMLALAAALAVYFGVYVYRTFNVPYTTTLAYQYTVNDSVPADGLLARQELVLPHPDGILDVIRAEGEKVGVGQTVALVYRDSQAQADQAQLEQLDLEIELLSAAAAQSGDVQSAARLDENIIHAVAALRASAALQDYSTLETQVRAVKSSVLKRSYTYGEEGGSATQLAAQLQALKDRRAALGQQTSTATTQVTAAQSGTFSSLVDGYEGLLTPETALSLTPSRLAALMAGDAQGDASAVGKLVTSNRCYFAAAIASEAAQRLREGGSATLRFTGDFSRDVDMTVEKIGEAEGDKTLVVFSSDRHLNETTLLRHLTAELIFSSYSGLRIPKESLHMIKFDGEDPDTGETTQQSMLGVYVLVSGRVELKEADIVMEASDYYVVRSTSQSRTALRAGDKVITSGVGIFSGQLLTQ